MASRTGAQPRCTSPLAKVASRRQKAKARHSHTNDGEADQMRASAERTAAHNAGRDRPKKEIFQLEEKWITRQPGRRRGAVTQHRGHGHSGARNTICITASVLSRPRPREQDKQQNTVVLAGYAESHPHSSSRSPYHAKPTYAAQEREERALTLVDPTIRYLTNVWNVYAARSTAVILEGGRQVSPRIEEGGRKERHGRRGRDGAPLRGSHECREEDTKRHVVPQGQSRQSSTGHLRCSRRPLTAIEVRLCSQTG
ncbi:hypothetical protein DFH06DRAFT_1123825 [Mycena polygramma]|nr:hypothetical protein DFH06DRAFT_1123825 [Mycena polygramma]